MTAFAGRRRPPTRRSCCAGRRCARWRPWSPWAARLRPRLPRGRLTARRVRRAAAQTTRGHPRSGSRTHMRQRAGAMAGHRRRCQTQLLLQAGEAQACRRSCARMSLQRPGTWAMRCAGCCTSCCWRRRTGRYSMARHKYRGDMRGLLVDSLLLTELSVHLSGWPPQPIFIHRQHSVYVVAHTLFSMYWLLHSVRLCRYSSGVVPYG